MENEKRLVDVEKLMENAKWYEGFSAELDSEVSLHYISVADLKSAPTVDAVEVVRCKDCKHWCEDTLSCMCGNHYDDNWYAEDFCSYGERRTDG